MKRIWQVYLSRQNNFQQKIMYNLFALSVVVKLSACVPVCIYTICHDFKQKTYVQTDPLHPLPKGYSIA